MIFAKAKYIRISPTKIDVIIKKIRHKSYKQALDILRYLPQRATNIVWKTLYSAVSNAMNNFHIKKENLMIKEIFVNQAGILKRQRARAKGRTFRIQKKVSHLTIIVTSIKI